MVAKNGVTKIVQIERVKKDYVLAIRVPIDLIIIKF